MSNKPAQNDSLKDRLSRYREITITVTGRKSGRASQTRFGSYRMTRSCTSYQ